MPRSRHAILALVILLGAASLPAALAAPFQDDLVVGFGSPGTWQLFDDTSWSKLHALTPERIRAGDLNLTGRDDLVVDFGQLGMWARHDDAAWTRLTLANAVDFVLGDLDFDGRDEVIGNFGADGLWILYNDSVWWKLDSRSPLLIAVGQLDDDRREDLVVVLPGLAGTWVWGNNSGWYRLKSNGVPIPDPVRVVPGEFCGDRGMVFDFGPGIYLYCQDWTFYQSGGFPYEWKRLHTGTAEQMVACALDGDDSRDDLLVDFGAQGTWLRSNAELEPVAGSWSPFHALSPEVLTCGRLDLGPGQAIDDPILSFEPGGTWIKYNNATWVKRHDLSPDFVVVAETNRAMYTCLDLLGLGHVVEADDCLAGLLLQEGIPQELHVFKAVSEVLRVFFEQSPGTDPDPGVFTDSLKELLDAFGVSAEDRNPLNATAEFPDPLLSGSPAGADVQQFLRTQLVAAIDGALTEHLSQIGSGFATLIDSTDATELDEAFDLDYADVKVLQGALNAWKAALLWLLTGHDIDVDIDELGNWDEMLMGPFMVQDDLLDPYPLLLALSASGANDLPEARAALIEAADCYYEASDYVRNADDMNQTDDLFTIDPADLQEEQLTRAELCQVRCSLDGQACTGLDGQGFYTCDTAGTLPPEIDGEPTDLSAIFDSDLRSLLPGFLWDPVCENDTIDLSTIDATTPFPDPTLGGVFPGQTQSELLADLEIPGQPRVHGPFFFFSTLGITFPFLEYEGEFSPALSIDGLAFDPGGVFDIGAATPGFPLDICPYQGFFFELDFDAPASGAYQEILHVATGLGTFDLPVLGCSGFPGDCNDDALPDSFVADLGRCDATGRVVASTGTGMVEDPCTGSDYPDVDPGDGDGVLDDCDCDGVPDLYRDLGKCASGGRLLPSPGTGGMVDDPCVGPFVDAAAGQGDGLPDDCDCDGFNDP